MTESQVRRRPQQESGLKTKGRVEAFHMTLGYGNIVGEDGVSYFVHQSNITTPLTNRGLRGLIEGQLVEFVPCTKKANKPQAYEVEVPRWKQIHLLPFKEVDAWTPYDDGVVSVTIDNRGTRHGVSNQEAQPCAELPNGTLLYYTGRRVSGFSFTLPQRHLVVALGLDNEKNVVANDAVPLDGTILIVRRRVDDRNHINIKAVRFGKRHDEYGGRDTNILIVEERLALDDIPADVIEPELEELMDVLFEGQVLLPYNKQFIPAILEAISRLK
ncbi:MAG: Cold-shock DNA-binding domain [Candidatus Parcubacteria bacterium]|jgi:cold shock CspA family protein